VDDERHQPAMPAAPHAPALPLLHLEGCRSRLAPDETHAKSKISSPIEVNGGGVKIFSSLKHNLLQQFPHFPSQLVGLTMPHHLLLYKVSGSH
jgi:hypothetical protein